MDGIPVFDFNNPWVALIQIVLFYVLPRVVGLVTDRLTASVVKIILLGALSVVGSALTWLLDVAVANSWATLDWTALVNVIVNAAITFALAQGVYKGVIVPLGQNKKDAESTVIQFIPADPKLVAAEEKAA
jgi:predicted Na+-dependent transporter